MDRRHFLAGGIAMPLAGSTSARAPQPIYIGDMHTHLFFVGPKSAASRPLGKAMIAGNATLVSWALVGDVPWLRLARGGFKQSGMPRPTESVTWFQQELDRIKRHIVEQGLRIVSSPADIDRALQGERHVVISVEGATFLDGGIAQLHSAYDAGVRQIQLVHYIRNSIGDFQTEPPQHDGLTALGRQVVAECNRLGILVDLAHCTPKAVADALAVSQVPLVWSHSSVTRGSAPDWLRPVWQARQLTLEAAKSITKAGGVVGLWALGADVGPTVESYTSRLLELADWLGHDHVAFGTDMNALSNPAIASFADLRRVVRLLEQRKLPESSIRKLAIENYAGVLRNALAARRA